jgi:hypothetical protein
MFGLYLSIVFAILTHPRVAGEEEGVVQMNEHLQHLYTDIIVPRTWKFQRKLRNQEGMKKESYHGFDEVLNDIEVN